MVDTGVLLDRATLLLERGRVGDAETAARQVLSKEPYNDGALALLGRCAYDGSHFKDGMGFIREALALRPEGSFYYYLLAFGHYQLGEHDAATSHLETAQAFQPHVAEYFGLYAFVLLAKKAWPQALQKADEGLAQEADNLTCLNARALALNGLRRTAEAIEAGRDALALDPHHELTHNTVAWNYLQKGVHKKAQHHFQESLRLNPNSEGARAGLKEALKSNIAPYRWLMQYQFWLQHRGKKWQTAAPFVIFILFRLLGGLLGATEGTKGLVWVPLSVYLLLVVVSWTIGPIANFVLLFNPQGRYALTRSERWQALLVVAFLTAGAFCMATALLAADAARSGMALVGGLILFTLALPLGDVLFPLQWKGAGRRVKMAMLLVGFGLLAASALVWMPQSLLLPALYGGFFILYNWSGLLR